MKKPLEKLSLPSLFELNIALKYLVPRMRYLSVSMISVISVLVIATVVWLTIVFFSATEGLEKRWTEKLIALTAPVRVTPQDAYYKSYYYMIDAMTEHSGFAAKSLREKQESEKTDPYNAEVDPALSSAFPKPDLNEKREVLDLVKETKSVLESTQGVKNVKVSFFDTAFANVRLRLVRFTGAPSNNSFEQESTTHLLSQASYLINFDPTQNLGILLLAPTIQDKVNIQDVSARLGTPLDLEVKKVANLWQLPSHPHLGQGAILPKSFRDSGVLIGDSGTFNYFSPSATGLHEQHIPFFVAGFYDPGIIPIGGKLILASEKIVSQIEAASLAQDTLFPTGFNVQFDEYKKAPLVQAEIESKLHKKGLDRYFAVQTYDHFDFTKDIFQQLKSEKNLFSLIAIIIVIVACSNIISMLVILVHDKKKEVAILRALGATKKSIGFIFGLSGFLMGAGGSIIGSIAAYFTVKHLDLLLQFLGHLQGFDVLNAQFFGTSIPNEVSAYAVWLVISATAFLSTIAGLFAALQACRQNTSEALRSE
jgi:lipoprotein-releasing system permease protein